MAGDSIRIPIDQVRAAGSEFKLASQQSLEIVKRLQRAVGDLETQWEGYAQQRFFQEYRQWETMMRQLSQLLEDVGVQLQAVAGDFEEADRQAARKLT
ncbi:MAG: WXG100 family type VII secretion target, partial [Gemmataceae bacterium]|nr:WXG100 family type VII secretion target [Gemmataceae bacterium]